MEILSNPMKTNKIYHVAEYFSPRVFRAGRNQNILGVCTRRDLFKSEECFFAATTFQKKKLELKIEDFSIFRTAHVHLPTIGPHILLFQVSNK